MIIHKLIAWHLKHRDDQEFYRFQALDAIGWMERNGLRLAPNARVLDLGCGHGVFGAEFLQRGHRVTFSDYQNGLLPSIPASAFRRMDIDRDDLATLGQYDLVICSNVYEHLAQPAKFLTSIGALLQPGGWLYLSWTNWLSPWGGHEFSPFHYLGPSRGHLVHDRLGRCPRLHTPYQNIFPTYIGASLKRLRQVPDLQIMRVVPRYYPELAFLVRLPVLREFLTWNCAVWLQRVPAANRRT
jgi:SAM-dependent methyltransferase